MLRIVTKQAFYKGIETLDANSVILYDGIELDIDLIIRMKLLEPYIDDNNYFDIIKSLYLKLQKEGGINLLRAVDSSSNLRVLFEVDGFIGEFECKKLMWFKDELCFLDIIPVDNISKMIYNNDVKTIQIRNCNYEWELHSCLPTVNFQKALITQAISMSNNYEIMIPLSESNRCYFKGLENLKKETLEKNFIKIHPETIREVGIEKDVKLTLNYHKKEVTFYAEIHDTKIKRNRDGIEEEVGYLYYCTAILSFQNFDELYNSVNRIKGLFEFINERRWNFINYADMKGTRGMSLNYLQNELSVKFSIVKNYA